MAVSLIRVGWNDVGFARITPNMNLSLNGGYMKGGRGE